MTDTHSPERQAVTWKAMLSYGVGQMGAQVVRDTPAVLLPVFMTTLLGIPAWLSGFVVLGPKIWLIFCDPLMGALSDKVKPRHGRKPFLYLGAILTALSFVALFSFSQASSPFLAALVIGALFLVTSTAFSAYTVPYLAIASELSTDPHERTKILTCRVIFASIGVVLSIGLAQPLVAHFGGGAGAWQVMAVILGGVSLLCMLATPLGLDLKKNGTPDAPAAAGLLDGIKAARRNKPFLVITATHFIHSSAQACSYTVVAFLFIYVVGKIALLLPFIILMSLAAVVFQPFWLMLSRQLGKRSAFIIATLAWCLSMVSWMTVSPGKDVLMTLPFLGPLSSQDVLVLVRGMAVGITNAGVILLTLSMLTDTINAGAQGMEASDEGALSGIFSSIEKMAFAIGPLLAGVGLSLTGYQSSVSGVIAQSGSAVSGILLIYSVVPTVMGIATLAVFRFYSLEIRPDHGAGKLAVGGATANN